MGLSKTGVTAGYTNDNNTTFVGCNASLCDLTIGCDLGNTYTEEDSSFTCGESISVHGGALVALYYYINGMPYEQNDYSLVPTK